MSDREAAKQHADWILITLTDPVSAADHNLARAYLELLAELEQERKRDRCQHGIRWPHPCDDCERERQERDDARLQAERKAREEPVDGYWFSWIPVQDKLPKIGSWVIGYDTSRKTVLRVCHFAHRDFRVDSASHPGGWIGLSISHWMPMPEFPS